MVSASEFSQVNNFEYINGTYLLPEKPACDSSKIYFRMNEFNIRDMVKGYDKELLQNKNFENITIFFDGKKKITFSFCDGDKSVDFTYKCKPKDNYVEIYFIKRRIWALPLFMSYAYDRLRLGIDKESNLIVHKWDTNLTTLTIMPFDSFGEKDYTQTLIRLAE